MIAAFMWCVTCGQAFNGRRCPDQGDGMAHRLECDEVYTAPSSGELEQQFEESIGDQTDEQKT